MCWAKPLEKGGLGELLPINSHYTLQRPNTAHPQQWDSNSTRMPSKADDVVGFCTWSDFFMSPSSRAMFGIHSGIAAGLGSSSAVGSGGLFLRGVGGGCLGPGPGVGWQGLSLLGKW